MAQRLFKPIKVGDATSAHRFAMAPLTRFRANEEHVHTDLARQYYEQRGSVPGTMLITEATFISPQASGYGHVPGIWNDKQIKAWKVVTNAVHKKGSFIFCQLWALGRVAVPSVLEKEGDFKVVSSSATQLDENHAVPTELTETEIAQYVKDYAQAAKNAIEAGFDGVEIHAANGYLIDQFWQDNCNKRTDRYGGSIERRATFGLEVTQAVVEAIGSKKTGIRLSPFSEFQGMRMKEPIPQFSHIVRELKKFDLAYLHLVESRITGDSASAIFHDVNRENDELIKIWGPETPIVLAGGFNVDKAKKIVGEVYTNDNVIIAFGRLFISTPDLPFRAETGLPMNDYDRSTFYWKEGDMSKGYIDYPFSKEFEASQSRL